jgi:hypothetical protein
VPRLSRLQVVVSLDFYCKHLYDSVVRCARQANNEGCGLFRLQFSDMHAVSMFLLVIGEYSSVFRNKIPRKVILNKHNFD